MVTRTDGPVSGTALHDSGRPGPRIAVIARMHGNEPLGDPVLERLDAELPARLAAGSVLAVRANERAAALDRRHTPEGSDLNRLWDRASLARLAETPRSAMSYEESRAHELAPLLAGCAAILDLHSTSRPAAPFLVHRDDQAHAAIAIRLGVRNLVTGVHENGVLSGGMCANLGLAPGERGPRLGFVFEAGQHTDPENGARAWEVTLRLLEALGLVAATLPPSAVRAEIFEMTERFLQAPAGEAQWRFVGYEGGEAGGGRARALPPRLLHSFEEICADEMLVRRGAEVHRAESPFTMLMPAPTTPPGTDLFYVAQARHGGLTHGAVRSDEEARREAVAIERMLDLTTDDEFERGGTWVAFDTRRLFDLCAQVVARTVRLDPADPDRALVVVGRGDHGLEEADRRAGQRYRHAMRTALAEGVRVERIQLLRGAPLGWIEQLTGAGMCDLLARRAAAGAAPGGVTMRFSTTKAHTVSLLVAGDLDRAISTGDARKVRVVLLVEATTVASDGGVHVARCGLVGSRPELLRAAHGMIATLRTEHADLVQHGLLRGAGELDATGALVASADRARMGALGDLLRAAQWRAWVEALRPELVDGEPVADRGRWLARLMTTTGVLDPEALEALLLRPSPDGWRVTTDALDVDLPEVPEPVAHAHLPTPALFAREVGADDLERWVGALRFVRSVQVVPDLRGKDLDLAFDRRAIHERLVRWYVRARELAKAHPGRVTLRIAGDGNREGSVLHAAHDAALLDPDLVVVRIQHLRTTPLQFLRGMAERLRARPAGAGRAEVRCEAAHGGAVSAVSLAIDDDVVAAGVVLADLAGSGDAEVGVFTEDGGAHARSPRSREVVAFVRAHFERLEARTEAVDASRLGDAVRRQLARWGEQVRVWRPIASVLPPDAEGRGRWVASRLGLGDPALARALARQLDDDRTASQLAEDLWRAGAHSPPG